jgi:hypothetical protein
MRQQQDHLQHLFGDKSSRHDRIKRRVLTLTDVPASNDGLRALAAGGNWAAVQNLSAKLAHQQVDRNTGKRDIEPYVQYALVQLTALVKTEQFASANDVLDRLGDLDGASYIDSTGRSLIPFSLRFLHAVLPQSVNNAAVAFSRLIALMERVERERSALADATNQDADTSVLSKSIIDGGTSATLSMKPAELERRSDHRWRRTARALAINSFERGDVPLALSYMRRLADAVTSPVDAALIQQQVGCAALRCGDFVSAQEAFKALTVDNLAREFPDDDVDSFSEIVSTVNAMNTALTEIFGGRFNDALKRLFEIAAPALNADVNLLPKPQAIASSPTTSMTNEILVGNGAVRRTGALPTTLTLRLLAANTYIVCHQYAVGSDRCSITNSVASFEGLLRRYPIEVVRFQPLVLNIRRLGDWQGEVLVNRRALLESVIDSFVAGKETLPKWLRA